MKRTAGWFCLFLFLAARPAVAAEGRSFLMGSTPFFASTSSFPTWRLDDLADKDLLSVHAEDFHGIPWDSFISGAPLPPAWVARWEELRSLAVSSGKTLYLSVAPLGGATLRKTLTADVNAAGVRAERWATPVDSSGCYIFSDPRAAVYQRAYVEYCKYVIDLLNPRFFSPAIETNISFDLCPAQKEAYKVWYTGVHAAIKRAYPRLTVFPTFQMEHMYGIVDNSACPGGVTGPTCFGQRLTEVLALPGDRIAFSMYPINWEFRGQSIIQQDPFAVVQAATDRRIWVSETGWQAVRIRLSSLSCADIVPASIANEAKQAAYMDWLLNQARERRFEGVVWWLNRDVLHGPTAETCPCSGHAPTCALTGLIDSLLGAPGELLFRYFTNMGLRSFDGAPRSAQAAWARSLALPLEAPSAPARGEVRAFPNPLFLSRGQERMSITGLPPGASVKVLDASSTLIKELSVDAVGAAAWDGRDKEGRPAPSGVYFVNVRSSQGRQTLKVALRR